MRPTRYEECNLQNEIPLFKSKVISGVPFFILPTAHTHKGVYVHTLLKGLITVLKLGTQSSTQNLSVI